MDHKSRIDIINSVDSLSLELEDLKRTYRGINLVSLDWKRRIDDIFAEPEILRDCFVESRTSSRVTFRPKIQCIITGIFSFVKGGGYKINDCKSLSRIGKLMENIIPNTSYLGYSYFPGEFHGRVNKKKCGFAAIEIIGLIAIRSGFDFCGTIETIAFIPEEIEKPLNIFKFPVKHPYYATVEKRLASFNSWPSVLVNKEDLVKAGFVYVKRRDITTCFCCGFTIYAWEFGDDPWFEHIRCFPHCKFLIQERGEDFIKLGSKVNNIMESNLLENVALKSIPKWFIRTILMKRFQEEGTSFAKSVGQATEEQNFFAKSVERATEEQKIFAKSVEQATEEQKICEIEKNLLCNICMEEKANIVFFPCKHLAVGETCSSSLKICPICREKIVSCVDVFIS